MPKSEYNLPIGRRQGCDETHHECLRKRLGASLGTARKVRVAWWAWEVHRRVQARVDVAGRYTKKSKKGKGRI